MVVVLGVLDDEELDVEDEELGVEDELDEEEVRELELDDDDELGGVDELDKTEELEELGELDEDKELEDFWAPGAAMMNIPTTSMTRTPTPATATFLLFKLDYQFSRTI